MWAQATSTVAFSGFDNPDAVYQVDALCKTPRPVLADTNGVNNWEQWCYNITSQNDVSTEPGEFTHFGVVIDPSQHQNDSGIKSTIQSSMTVSPNDGDYDKDFKTSGGPLDCEVWEANVTGYTPIYTATNGTDSADGCSFENFSCGSHGVCDINHAPDPVDVDIDKVWNFVNSPGDDVDTQYRLR